jgi:lipoprotein-releasing system permease protein
VYKYLLCWRYLRSRYIALASIVSVTLGVATMIVVNAVMAGFAREMQQRLHNILSDVVLESHSLEGFRDPEWHMELMQRAAGDDIERMVAAVHVPAMLSFQYGGRGEWITRPVTLIGIDDEAPEQAAEFRQYLQHPQNRKRFSFRLRDGGYDVYDHQAPDRGTPRPEMRHAGWTHRRRMAELRRAAAQFGRQSPDASSQQGEHDHGAAEDEQSSTPSVPHDAELRGGDTARPAQRPSRTARSADPFARGGTERRFDPRTEQHTGLVMGIGLASFRLEGTDRFLLLPGDDVRLTFPTAGTPPRAVDDTFTIVDFYESKMSEYDSSLVFVPLRRLQELRGMIEPETGIGYVTSIQIKLKPGRELNQVRDKLRALFPPQLYSVSTWRDKQGALLAAVHMETAILNVLLFLIIAVAGFGILAIFFMIVVEKTRDIGILKSLGAGGRGIMGIFLFYGLLLGLAGSGVGMVLGLAFTQNINAIADALGRLTGRPVFDPDIYYFYEIPALIEWPTVTWIVLGALGIAALASVLPARRAARLHPVEALRYE